MTRNEVERIEKEAIRKGNWKAVEKAAKAGNQKDLVAYGSVEFRRRMAHHHICLEELVYDESVYVRKAVVYAGYGFDILIDDPDERVRMAIAYKGYGLDQLVNDESWKVRCAVASISNHYIDILSNDDCWHVRKIVASKCTDTRFFSDRNKDVRETARHQYIKNHKCPVHEYIYHDPIETRQDYISSYNYDGYSEDYYDYN